MAEPNEAEGQAGTEGTVDEGATQRQEEGQAVESTVDESSPSGEATDTIDEDKEPGGTDPTAVYARKQRQERNRLAKQLATEREARIRLDERLKTLETQRKENITQPKVWTPAEVRNAVAVGTITQEEAAVFLADQTAKETYRKLDLERQQKEAKLRPVIKAQQDISQYLEVAPYLTDDNDPKTQSIVNIYNQYKYDHPELDEWEVKAMAIKTSLGPVENLRKQRQSAGLTRDNASLHVSRSGGGSVDRGGTSDEAVLANAPAHFKEHWDKFNTPTKDRITEIKLHYKRHPKK